MLPDRCSWLQRWLQREDEELLYVDQTLGPTDPLGPTDRGLTLEDLDRAVEATRQHAAAQARERELRALQDARLRWATLQEDAGDES